MKKNVILDLDNTLISSVESNELDVNKHKELTDMVFYNMDNIYVVFERPHLQEFLDFLFKNFNVSIWTAATKDYALFIINKIILSKSDRNIDYVLFNYHCYWSEKSNCGHKGLKLLWDNIGLFGYNKDNTYIIDDLSEIKESQPNNAIKIKPFEIENKNSENDTELLTIMEDLKKIQG